MEATVPVQTSRHFYIDWAKERLDEMDATLASLEHQASEVQAASREKADQMLADLRKRRHEFQEGVKMQAEASEAVWLRTKAQLDAQWNGFEAEVKKYIEAFKAAAIPPATTMAAANGVILQDILILLSEVACRRASRPVADLRLWLGELDDP
jgi:ElaB/YqjD/DUF883 family membrane-anchored ribosome-binding protein